MPESNPTLKDYEITVMSGKLTGSVQISGELPRVWSHDQAGQLVEAIQTVRDAAVGHKVMVTFGFTQPRNSTWAAGNGV